jgi:hypothetical protein
MSDDRKLLFYRASEHTTVLSCRLCPHKRFRVNGGSLTAHGDMHVRLGTAVRDQPGAADAEQRYAVKP